MPIKEDEKLIEAEVIAPVYVGQSGFGSAVCPHFQGAIVRVPERYVKRKDGSPSKALRAAGGRTQTARRKAKAPAPQVDAPEGDDDLADLG